MPPVYQPEVPARAIVFAAFHPRREIWVGFPTVVAILAERIAPGLADWYLARNGYRAQMTTQPQPAEAPANLYTVVPGDVGAHGRFSAEARNVSGEIFTSRQRGAVTFAAFVLAVLAGRRLLRKRS